MVKFFFVEENKRMLGSTRVFLQVGAYEMIYTWYVKHPINVTPVICETVRRCERIDEQAIRKKKNEKECKNDMCCRMLSVEASSIYIHDFAVMSKLHE